MKKFLIICLISTFSVSSSWAMFRFLEKGAERGARAMVKRYSIKGFKPESTPDFQPSGRKLPKDVTFLGKDSELFIVNSERQSSASSKKSIFSGQKDLKKKEKFI